MPSHTASTALGAGKPILMSAPMVRAILRDVDPKTQTRRIVKPQPEGEDSSWPSGESCLRFGDIVEKPDYYAGCGWCPHGQRGSRLWVKETFALVRFTDETVDEWKGLMPKSRPPEPWVIVYAADGKFPEGCEDRGFKWRPSIFLPRWASRITLEIESVRVERLNDISEEDAKAEGVETDGKGFYAFYPMDTKYPGWTNNPRDSYKSLWDAINGPGSWDASPWVWVITFRRLAKEPK